MKSLLSFILFSFIVLTGKSESEWILIAKFDSVSVFKRTDDYQIKIENCSSTPIDINTVLLLNSDSSISEVELDQIIPQNQSVLICLDTFKTLEFKRTNISKIKQ
jgi:hypothetical protein